LLLGFDKVRIEVPAVDLLFHQPKTLLGETVHARFGYEFPILFSSRTTLGGLSEPLTHGDGWREERVNSNERAAIETRRHWFTKPVTHHTRGIVNVLNLVEGEEAIVESPTGAFEPYVVHYAETFIVPAAVGAYTIRPYGQSVGKECATLKAYVRI